MEWGKDWKRKDFVFWFSITYFISITFILILFSGCISCNDVHDYYKEGIVLSIDEDVVFGGTFTDWRHDIYFDDDTILSLEHENDLSKIRLNEFGRYHFKTNFFDYNGRRYEFYNLIDVRYNDSLEI